MTRQRLSLRGGTTKQSRTLHNRIASLRLPRYARNNNTGLPKPFKQIILL